MQNNYRFDSKITEDCGCSELDTVELYKKNELFKVTNNVGLETGKIVLKIYVLDMFQYVDMKSGRQA